jgi:hypothetical protein
VVNLPDYTQITLTDQNLLPLEDLGASAGYNRSLLLPDDLPGVIALPWAIGPTRPRVNQCQADGSLNVFMTGQSGGGGLTVAPMRPTQFDGPNDSTILQTGSNLLIPDVQVGRLWAYIHVEVYPDLHNSALPNFGFVGIQLVQNSTITSCPICSLRFGQGATANALASGSSFTLAPPGGIDYSGVFTSAAQVDLEGFLIDAGAFECIVSATIAYL